MSSAVDRGASDAETRARVKRALAEVPALASQQIDVQVLGGHVLLTGWVYGSAHEQLALDTVMTCDGVRFVVSGLAFAEDRPFRPRPSAA